MPFRLIQAKTVTINRAAQGGFVEGVYTKGVVTSVDIKAVVYPIIKQDILTLLPEALRTRKVIRLFTNQELNEHNSQQAAEADELVYAGKSYRVFKLGDWIDVSGFTGRDAYAVQIDAKELSLLN
jgi:hypothetical protein